MAQKYVPLYVAALALLTAALFAVDAVPRYVVLLVPDGGLLTLAVGSWRESLDRPSDRT